MRSVKRRDRSYLRLAVVFTVIFAIASSTALTAVADPAHDVNPAPIDGGAGGISLHGSDRASDLLQRQETPTNNTTVVRHRDPDAVDEEGDLRRVQAHLARNLSRSLTRSVIRVDERQYEAARSVLGTEYDSRLAQFVEITGETDEGAARDAMRGATQRQHEFINLTQEYRETREAYRTAKEEGDEEQARELARELDQQAENVTRSGTRLVETYAAIDNETDANLTAAETTVEGITRTVARDQDAIQSGEFTATRLRVSQDRKSISFVDPLSLTGHLETANGTPVANRTVTLQVGSTQHRVQTDAGGQFRVRHRPRTIPLSATSLTVQYLSAVDSPYLGSNATVPITIDRQVRADIRLSQTPQTAEYSERIVVAGAVRAANRSVSHVPVRVSLGGADLGTVRTNRTGRFRVVSHLPAAVRPGEQSVVAVLAQENRSVTADEARVSVAVTPTATRLSIAGQRAGRDRVIVTGRLQTHDGVGIAGQPIRIGIDGTSEAIVETNETGRYRVAIPIRGRPNATVVLDASFSRPTTNLEPSTAETRLRVPAAEEGPSRSDPASPVTVGIVALLAGLLVVGSWHLWRRRRGRQSRDSTPGGPTAASSEVERNTEWRSLLSAANSAVERDPNEAVTLAYGALRRAVDGTVDRGATNNLTHWEFYDTCSDAENFGGGDGGDGLLSLTQWYERAMYSPTGVNRDTAQRAVDTVDRLVGDGDTNGDIVNTS